uniref:mannan endo-1,4-beta-mannosidase n=1 Tax=Leersia perrieri TaxID=77586 RepID=A0A0D9W0Y5_9ORYZ
MMRLWPAATIIGVVLLVVVFPAAAGGDGDVGGMVGVEGTRFVVDGGSGGKRTVYFSGFNAYWLMMMASDPARRGAVVTAFRQAAAHGLNLARTWAFSDGGDQPLQSSPGVYNEAMFQGLDFVIAEARRHGIYLLLCLTNNFNDFGGKRQYVRWAADAGVQNLTSADHFFTNPLVKSYYKNHVKKVLTRVNTVTGVAYKDDPTILAWELMNEPRCDADPTGVTVQAWVEEMAPYVKRIDGDRHLVTAGLEGFYGDGEHESKELNPWGIYYGTNYIATHLAAGVDFATIHLYPDVWLWGSTADEQARFFTNWTQSHVAATAEFVGKPLLVTEYGKFLWKDGGGDKTQRNYFLGVVLDAIYASASSGGPLVGGAFWQLLLDDDVVDGMDDLRDGYEIILPDDTSAATIIGEHSQQLAALNGQDAAAPAPETRRHRKTRVGSLVNGGGGDFKVLDGGALLWRLAMEWCAWMFVVDGGRTIYFSGFNAYWLMMMAFNPAQRDTVVTVFEQASTLGLNLARTWAFSDGGNQPLQSSPGVYNEAMFQGLDFVIAEARQHGIYLLLCLTNNFDNFGGKRQYVQWAIDAGHNLTDVDEFFTSTIVKSYYKNHVKTVLTRVNTLTGVAYKDDPTIFAWELMNEPRSYADPAGGMVQAWVEEMAPYVKSVDGKHLVTPGLEGFYGEHESKRLNPWGIYYGTNYVATHQAVGVDFATIHLYPDVWLWGSTVDEQARFFQNWTRSHIDATMAYLGKPLLVTEYGTFILKGINVNKTQRNYFLSVVLDTIYASASQGGPLVGGAFWQLLLGGMDNLRDGYEIVLPEDTRAVNIIGKHSKKLAALNGQDAETLRSQASSHWKTHLSISLSSCGTLELLQMLFDRFICLSRSISSFIAEKFILLELHKLDKDKDVNLLEPMNSSDFDAIQGVN